VNKFYEIFLHQNAPICAWQPPGSARTRWGAYSASLDLLATLTRESTKRGDGKDGSKRGDREGKREERERGEME